MTDQKYLYQWEHETGNILGMKHELRELEDVIKQMNDYIDSGMINEPFDWDLISFDSNNLTNGFSIAI